MNDNFEKLLDRASDIENRIDSIQSQLADQFTSVDGVGYATQQIWAKAVNVEIQVNRMERELRAIGGTLVLIFLAVCVHVVRHW